MALRVCYFGTYRAAYARNQIMIAGLRRAGVDVIECNVQLWQGIEDRVETASGGWMRPAFWRRLWGTYRQLLKRFAEIKDFAGLGYFHVYLPHRPRAPA